MGHFRSIICGLAVEVNANALRVLHKLISRANQASVPRRSMLIALQSFSHLFSKFCTLKLNLRVVKFKRIFSSHKKFLARVEWFLLLTNWTVSERWQVAIQKWLHVRSNFDSLQWCDQRVDAGKRADLSGPVYTRWFTARRSDLKRANRS